jgi:hypothetical protein
LDILFRQLLRTSLADLLLKAFDHGTQAGGPMRAQQVLHFSGLGMQQQRARQAIAGDDEFLA